MGKNYQPKNVTEVLDATPVSLPLRFSRPVPLADQIRNAVRVEFSQYAEDKGYETFDEAEDFDVDDEYDPSSPWEREFDPALGREVSRQEKKYLNDHRKKFDKEYRSWKRNNRQKKQDKKDPAPKKQEPGTGSASSADDANGEQ